MEDRNGQNRRDKPRTDASEIGRVRVFSKPGPDAEDRLRRLMSLMIKYATQDASEDDATSDPSYADDTGTDGIDNEGDGNRVN